MKQLLSVFLEAAIASVFLIPAFFHLDHIRFHNRKRSLLYALFAVYLAGMYAAAGLPNVTYIRYRPNINFEPFLYMFTAMETTLLNVLLFIPLGFFLAFLWKRFRKTGWNLLAGFSLSLAIEVLQIFTYRATDVNDLITNTFGTFLGWGLGCITKMCSPGLTEDRPDSDLGVIFLSVLTVMFFLHPFLSRLIRYILL